MREMPPEIRSRRRWTPVGSVLDHRVRPHSVQQSSQWVHRQTALFGRALISNGLEDMDQSCSHCGDRPINLAPLQREVSDNERTMRVFASLLTGVDGAANKRLVQVTSLRNRFACEFSQGFRFTLIEEAPVIHRVCLVSAGDDGVTPQILQGKDQQTAFHLRRIQEGTSGVDCSS